MSIISFSENVLLSSASELLYPHQDPVSSPIPARLWGLLLPASDR